MRYISVYGGFVALMGFFLSCSSGKVLSSGYGLIKGNLTYSEGNQMPSDSNSNNRVGVEREIYIFELTNDKDAVKDTNLYTKIDSKIVAKTTSNLDGDFEIKVKEGIYTILVKEDGGFYASILDENNNLHPVEVKSGQTQFVNIVIDYKAFY